MRVVVAAVLIVLSATAAGAQSTPTQSSAWPGTSTQTLPSQGTSTMSPRPGSSAIGLPLPPIGLPLAPVGLPLGSMGPAPSDPTPTTPRQEPPRPVNPAPVYGFWPPPLFVLPPYGYGWPAPSAGSHGTSAGAPAAPAREQERPAVEPPPAQGRVWLNLQPRPTGQIFVDGAFVGEVGDLGDTLTLEEGRRRIEVRESGYEPLVVDVRVEAGRTITYRDTLRPLATPKDGEERSARPEAKSSAPAIQSKPAYFIPGCYLGDVPPKDANLPASCDVSKTIVIRP